MYLSFEPRENLLISTMSTQEKSFEEASVFEAADPYVSSGDSLPGIESIPTSEDILEEEELSLSKEETPSTIRVDGEAYTALTEVEAEAATQIWQSDVRGQRWESDYLYRDKERYFQMLSAINRGEKNGPKWENGPYQTYKLRKDLTEIIGRRLNLSDHQIARATARAVTVDTRKFGRALVLVVFCTCAYVVHRDETGYAEGRKYHPNQDPEDRDSIFQEVAETYGLRQSDIDRVCRQFDQLFDPDSHPPRRFTGKNPNWKRA